MTIMMTMTMTIMMTMTMTTMTRNGGYH